MSFNIPNSDKKRVIIVGGGFAGLRLAQKLKNSGYQVVLIDKNNYNQFPPLIYQIATAGLHPSSISFPFRKLFEDRRDSFFRMTELRAVYPEENYIQTSIGKITYDYLVLASGTTTNFFNNKNIAEVSVPMKTVSEAMGLRNALLLNFERAVTCTSEQERRELLNIVIVGGGPSGVEIAGALAEMRKYILHKDYPDMDISQVNIHLIQGDSRLLNGMSEKSSAAALSFLTRMNVIVKLNSFVTDYLDNRVVMSYGGKIPTRNLIWVGGVTAGKILGIAESSVGRGNRILVDGYNRIKGYSNIFAIGDLALMQNEDPGYPNGHPQMAQPALQQGELLARNLKAMSSGKPLQKFKYRNLGCMATIGKHKAVADIGSFTFCGFTAWFLWMAVHLMSILFVRNKISVLMDWIWNYFTYDQSNRMILRSFDSQTAKETEQRLKEKHWGTIKDHDNNS
ncbi:MAG: NAD(P)/FAD-dependent oxidoreductase [Succinivibrionaceae bacterium]|nr:NAD(P)/FAD-dependent oxidoreductase [Succinivibrionaceae bacterium]